MLLAAVHGLRLGALVQLLTFGGFFLGFLLGTLVWVPLFGAGHHERHPLGRPRVAGPVHGLRPRHRSDGSWAPGATSPCVAITWAQVDSVLGVGVAVDRRPAVGVAGGGRHRVAEQPLHLPGRGRGPVRHPPFHRRRAAPGALGLQRPAELPERPGVPPGVRHARPRRSSPSVSTPSNAAGPRAGRRRRPSRPSRSSARRATTSRRGRASWSGKGLVVTNAHVVAGEGGGNTAGARRRHRLRRDRRAVRPEVRPGRAAHRLRRSARRSPSARTSCPGAPRRRCSGYPEDGAARAIGPAGVTEEVTAIGKDIYNGGSVTRGVYALDANVRAREFGRARWWARGARSSGSCSPDPPSTRPSGTR